MKKFSGYKETEVKEFATYEKLELGGHYCKITDVKEEKTANNIPYLAIKFDTADNDKQPLFYSKRFKQDVEQDATNAKWKGNYRLFIPNDDGSEKDQKTKESFKRFITVIEKSNNGYDWEKAGWDEKTLVGKVFIGVFGIREFKNMQEETLHYTECRFVRSTDNDIENIPIPRVKLVDGSYMEYDDWEELQNDKKKTDNDFEKNVIDDDSDDLPF